MVFRQSFISLVSPQRSTQPTLRTKHNFLNISITRTPGRGRVGSSPPRRGEAAVQPFAPVLGGPAGPAAAPQLKRGTTAAVGTGC